MSAAPALTDFLGDYLAAGRDVTPSAHAVESATELFTDTVGVMFIGSSEPCARIAGMVAATLGGHSQAVAVPLATRTSMTQAALVNGTAAHALDLDDSHHPGMLHPSAVLVPAILAVGEHRHISGRQAITALLYGLDVLAAIGNAVNPRHYDRGWHSTSTLGSVAAAASCARALDLPPDRTVAALSMAMTESCGIRRNFGSMTKPLHAGLAASNGVLAALLAEEGMSVGAGVLEGEKGWLDLMVGHENWNAEDLLSVLDHQFGLALEGLAIKRFASCGVTHPPIEAAQLLRNQGVKPSDVKELRLVVHPMVPGISSFMEPETGLQAKFSLPHCVAIMLVTGRAGLGEFTDEWVADVEVDELRRKVQIETDPTVGLEGHMSWGCRLTAVLTDGSEIPVEVAMARGKWAGERLPHGEVLDKFRECSTASGVDDSSTEACLVVADRLDDLADVAELSGAVLAAAHNRVGDAAPAR
jgi:2-methylcitrate dehydratase PrpD